MPETKMMLERNSGVPAACPMCTTLSEQTKTMSPWDTILAESDHFIAIPSLGSLVSGWILVVPKHHVLCVGALHHELFDELQEFVNAVKIGVANEFGQVIVFEHGPSVPSSSVGCTVDHAHIHIVPVSGSVFETANAIMEERINWYPVTNIEATRALYDAGQPYLYFDDGQANRVIGMADNLPSQLFRKAIATVLDKAIEYDWRSYPNVENILLTVQALKTV